VSYWLRWRSCLSKLRYPTRLDAANAARTVPKRRGLRARAYRCEWCDFWHVGHASKGRRERRR
jgi:hypothetical protein